MKISWIYLMSKKITPDLALLAILFVGPGKTYVGIRYPQNRTITPPLGQVMVTPEDGQPYVLNPREDLKKYVDKKTHPRFRNGAKKLFSGYEYDWGKDGSDMAKQLALAILADCVNDEIAKDYHKDFFEKIIVKLPELHFKISGPKEILTLYEAEIVMQSLSKVKG